MIGFEGCFNSVVNPDKGSHKIHKFAKLEKEC